MKNELFSIPLYVKASTALACNKYLHVVISKISEKQFIIPLPVCTESIQNIPLRKLYVNYNIRIDGCTLINVNKICCGISYELIYYVAMSLIFFLDRS